MNVHQLRYFSVAAKTRSLGVAAQREGTSEVALSQQIEGLEKELDTQLFRSRRRTTLTNSGKNLLAIVGKVIAELSQKNTPEDGDAKDRLVTVGAPPTIAPYVLPYAVADFQRNYPGIRVNLVEEVPARLWENLKDELIDVAVAQLPVAEKGISSEELIREPLYAVVPHDHRLADRKSINLKEFRDDAFILTKHELAFRDVVLGILKEANVQPDVLLETMGLGTIFAMVCSGLGVSLVPQMAIQKRRGCRILRVQNRPSDRTIGLVRSKDRLLGATKLLFVESLRQSVLRQPTRIP